jgi:hypothetical protein
MVNIKYLKTRWCTCRIKLYRTLHSLFIPQNLFMHMPNQIVFNLASTTLKANWLIILIVKTKRQTLDIRNSSYFKIYWCTCQNKLRCVVRYIFKFFLSSHVYVPLSPHVPLDQNTMDAQWNFECFSVVSKSK